ncbi:MAG: hypothetical protein M5R36_26855 [Deltaproteobacteria bacterium]|nr:hypothetical protein [Deltaproteobacteria bacterium]
MLYDFFAPRLEKSFLGGVMGRLESGGFVWTCVLRAIFFMSPPLSWMMGASSVRTKDYVLGNLVGLTPVIFLVQMASRRLSEVHKASDLLAVEPMVYLGAFLAFVVLAVYLRKRFLNR